MDWLKLFALLVAVVSIITTVEAVKKKIRIHLPQNVKHIHHHKKIYITNHPASSQYAPAYLPTADGAVAVPSAVAYSGGSGSLKSMEFVNERQPLPAISPAASKLLPLYRARGYYGPTPNDWEEQEIDLVPPPEPTGSEYVPSAFSSPSASGASTNYKPKKVKVTKVNQPLRKKKVVRKRKPKRVVHDSSPVDEEHPVTNYHEQFYSDLDGSGTIRKIRKPKRVEKIIDGNTEHIHTYSEEHIHKIVFDDPTKDVAHSLRNLAASSDSYASLSPIGSLGTPSHLEYAAYNPREVTHDHVFHDHGEVPANMDLTKDGLSIPPKVSYTSQGIKIGGDSKRPNPYSYRHPLKSTRPDLTYYENMYSTKHKTHRPVKHHSKYNDDSSTEAKIEDFRPIPQFRFKDKQKTKTPGSLSSPYYGHNNGYRLGQASVPVPFSATASNGFNYLPNNFNGLKATSTVGFNSFKDPFVSLKDLYSNNNYAYDTYASSSNNYNSENNESSAWSQKKGKNKGKKSISTQNINFGGQDLKTTVDHLAEASNLHHSVKDDPNYDDTDSATSTADFMITEKSPAHDYYTAMAIKAFQNDPLSMAEASNDNYQFAEAPTTPSPTLATTIESPRSYSNSGSRAKSRRRRPRPRPEREMTVNIEPRQKYTVGSTAQIEEEEEEASPVRHHSAAMFQRGRGHHNDDDNDSLSHRGKFKYGDKL